MAPAILTVIIPTLNEAENLPALLQDLSRQENILLEIIIADGGSTDATCALAAASSVPVMHARAGRGAQMNDAATFASGDYLLFLHADSRLDDPHLLGNALRDLCAENFKEKRTAGHFPLHFMRTSQRNAMAYRYVEEKSALNRANTTNGDQGLLLSKDFFVQLGGFDEGLPFLEDQQIAEKIRVQGRWITLPGVLKTSARRFESEGFHRRYILMSMIMGFHSIGVKEFFYRAPEVYRVQEETGKLLLFPFFSLIGRMISEWGVGGSIRIFYSLGRYIRKNSWQMFFFFDLSLRPCLGAGRSPFLNFHDRYFAPATDLKLCDAVTGLLAFVWFLGILAPFFWIIDRFYSPPEARGKLS